MLVSGGVGDKSVISCEGVQWTFLDQVSHVHGHLLHGGVVEALDVAKCAFVVFSHHVDGHPFSAETPPSANPVNVVFTVGRKVVIDDQGHLLYINSSGLVRQTANVSIWLNGQQPFLKGHSSIQVKTLVCKAKPLQ